MWHGSTAGGGAPVWSNTNLAMIGTPAVVAHSVHDLDVFYRDPDGYLMWAFRSANGAWQNQ